MPEHITLSELKTEVAKHANGYWACLEFFSEVKTVNANKAVELMNDELVGITVAYENGTIRAERIDEDRFAINTIEVGNDRVGDEFNYLIWGEAAETTNGQTEFQEVRVSRFSVPIEVPKGKHAVLRARQVLTKDDESGLYTPKGVILGKFEVEGN